MKTKYILICLSLLLTIISFNIYADNKTETLKTYLEDKKISDSPNANGLSHLGSKGYIKPEDQVYINLVNNLYEIYPQRFSVSVRISLAKELISIEKNDKAIDILLPLINEVKKRSVFWEYCSNWTFREAQAKELEGLFLLTELYLKDNNVDKALDVLIIIKQYYPFREKSIDSFLLFKEKLRKFNEKQKAIFNRLITKQLIFMNSNKWEELGLLRDDRLNKLKSELVASEPIDELSLNIEFYSFESEKYFMVVAYVSPNTSLVNCSFNWVIEGSYKGDRVFNNFVLIEKENLKNKKIKLTITDKEDKIIEKEYNILPSAPQ